MLANPYLRQPQLQATRKLPGNMFEIWYMIL